MRRLSVRCIATALLGSFLGSVLLLDGVSAQQAVAPKGDSTWEQVKRTGKLRTGVFDFPPYYVFDRSTRTWGGAFVEMAKDIASEMDVQLETVEVGGWGAVVLELQSNRIDLHMGFQATPKRATAIDFAGPFYWMGWSMVNAKGLNAKNWEDYNKPEMRVAVLMGSADDVILRKMAPRATRIELKELSQIVLAVSSGRADAFATTVLSSLIAKSKNPGVGDFVIPAPEVALPGYIAIRYEDDQRFLKFLNKWAEWNLILGHNERRLIDSLGTAGITDVPAVVKFSK
jgi:polar amino acid transport system substrate-binding protein